MKALAGASNDGWLCLVGGDFLGVSGKFPRSLGACLRASTEEPRVIGRKTSAAAGIVIASFSRMKSYTIRRVPWTCEWGRFGVAIEDLGAGQARVDDVFWACHHPERAPELRLTKRGECEHCPLWMEAAHFHSMAAS